jgi:hypothetical protein
MGYVIINKTEFRGATRHIIINDTEGQPMEFDSIDEAERVARLFKMNTTDESNFLVRNLS